MFNKYYEHLTPVKYGFDTAKSEPYAFASGICDFRGEVEIRVSALEKEEKQQQQVTLSEDL